MCWVSILWLCINIIVIINRGIDGRSSQSDHPERTLRFAIDTMSVIKEYNLSESSFINIRVGIHTGPVVAGVIGTKKFGKWFWQCCWA